jgi:hypothetical protein
MKTLWCGLVGLVKVSLRKMDFGRESWRIIFPFGVELSSPTRRLQLQLQYSARQLLFNYFREELP